MTKHKHSMLLTFQRGFISLNDIPNLDLLAGSGEPGTAAAG